MKKLFQLSSIPLVALILMGALILSLQTARADFEAADTGSETDLAYAAPVTDSLSLSIPDMPLVEETSKTLDLWDYTVYDGDLMALVYTATIGTGSSSYLDLEMNDHYLTLTASFFTKAVEVIVEASDGVSTTQDSFWVLINLAPDIDFYGGVYELEDPIRVHAGQFWTMTRPLESYADDPEDWDRNLSFSIVDSSPVSLGVRIFTVTGENDFRHIAIEPDADLKGSYQVEVEVMDSTGLTDTDTFTVSVLKAIHLPIVLNTFAHMPILEPVDNSDGDGRYTLEWDWPGHSVDRWETEFSFNDPTFANGQTNTTFNSYQSGFYTWPGTHYWRVRGHEYVDGEYVPKAWSNVESVQVGAFAYLELENLSAAFDLEITISGNGIQDSITLAPYDWGYWRSVPVGTYVITVNSQYPFCDPYGRRTRSEQITLQNTIDGGAWYFIDSCETTGPYVSRP